MIIFEIFLWVLAIYTGIRVGLWIVGGILNGFGSIAISDMAREGYLSFHDGDQEIRVAIEEDHAGSVAEGCGTMVVPILILLFIICVLVYLLT